MLSGSEWRPLTVPRRPYSIDVRVMQEENRIAWRQHGGHVATDRVVDDVVWGCFQDARESRLALIVARLGCTASYELGLQVDALHHRGRHRFARNGAARGQVAR